eukprot:NODE_133_length_18153_cov_0.298050.p1 type:complete len:555 gc:universal NODE_133_length_18153_cov_0.298050:9005-10669(+)
MYQLIQDYLSELFKNLNASNTSFYILFYDDYTSRVLNIFTIKQLRDYNIVDIKHINQLDPSDTVNDLTAIFYLSHVNVHFFVNHLNRYSKSVLFIHYTLNNIEAFADQLSRNPTDNIQLIFDTYTHYLAFDQFGISAPPIKQNPMQLLTNNLLLDKQLLTTSVHTLASLYMTMSTIPLIYTTNDPNCQYVSSELNDLFLQWNQEYQHQKSVSSNNFFDQFQLYSGYGGIRPILLIVNRSMDVLPFLMHSWSYNVLIYDLFKLSQNRITLPSTSTTAGQAIDIDPLDVIWKVHCNDPFPVVAEQIDKQLVQYKKKAQEVMAFAGVNATDINEVDLQQLNSTAQIKTVLTQLPELTQTKHVLDNHMNIATSLLSKMQEIQLDKVFESEENLMKLTINDIKTLLKNNTSSYRLTDKIRVALLWYLMKKTNYDDLHATLLELGGTGIGCLEYLESSRQQIKAAPEDLLGKFGGFGISTIGSKISENLNTAAFHSILNSVKNLMPFDTTSSIVKLTEQVLNTLQGGEVPNEIKVLDPLDGDNQVPFGGYVFPSGIPQVL